MKLFYISLFFINVIQFENDSKTQIFMGMEVDAICLVIYEPGTFLPPSPIPPPLLPDSSHLDSMSWNQKIQEQKKKNELRSISAITRKGKFNSKIIWESKQCLDSIDMIELDSILSKKKTNLTMNPPALGEPPLPPPLGPMMCYNPHHSIFLYKNNSVVYHYDICFACLRIKANGDEYLGGVEFDFLYDFYSRLGIPRGGEELKAYIAKHKRTE